VKASRYYPSDPGSINCADHGEHPEMWVCGTCLDLLEEREWDDAIHIAAPWEPRSTLCGNWNRNLVALKDPRPGGASGCWTCLIAAEWIDAATTKQEQPA
jgi:hypothetical protein